MSASLLSSLLSNTVTGNASAINGLTPGITTPNPSTRTAFQQSVALLNSPTTVGLNAGGSNLTATGTLNSEASTVTGVGNGFNGSSAISGANILGILNSDIVVGGNVGTVTNGTLTLENITSSATGTANSTASTVTGTSAAAVIDLAGVGLLNSLVTIGQSAGQLSFSGRITGDASATGVTVGGTPTAPFSQPPALNIGLDGSGVNSILNLNARGLSPQTQYFQDPISPFFAEFSGLPVEPNQFGVLNTTAFPIQVFNNNLIGAATVGAAAPATGTAVENQAALNGQVLFDRSTGAAITNLAVGDAISNATDIDGTVVTGNVTQLATANQLIDADGELLYTTNVLADQNATTAATIPAGSGDITIGQDGDVNVSATALGSSMSANTTGDTNAFAGVFSAGATLIDNIVIGQDGDITGTSNAGFDPNITNNPNTLADERVQPIETSSTTTTGSSSALTNILSIGIGTSAVRVADPTTSRAGGGPNGSIAPAEPALLSIGRDGNVSSTARAFSVTNSGSTTGDVVAFTGGLAGSGGNTLSGDFNPGNALTIGLFNVDINAVGHNNVSATAQSGFVTDAQTTTGNAAAASTTITAGIFGADLSGRSLTGVTPGNTTLDIVDGNVSGIAQAVNAVRANTITGNASAVANNTVVGIGNTDITIAGSGSITASANLTSLAGTLTP